jgi:Mce-associated membrane protein
VAPDDDTPTTVFEAAVLEPEVVEPETVVEPEPEPEPSGEISGDLRPSPRRKIRDTGIHKPISVEAVDATAAAKAAPVTQKTGRGVFLRAGALVVVGLLLAGAAVLFRMNANEISSATSNTALLDVAKTAQVKDQVSKAAETLFSYDFNDIAKTENAAKDLLVGDGVRAKYDKLMGEVKRLAPTQKMVVTSRVTRSGVIMLNGDLAKVMVFIDQTSTRTDTKQTSAGSAQLHLNAQLQDGKWKITDMDTYTAPAAPAAPSTPAASSPAPPSK